MKSSMEPVHGSKATLTGMGVTWICPGGPLFTMGGGFSGIKCNALFDYKLKLMITLNTRAQWKGVNFDFFKVNLISISNPLPNLFYFIIAIWGLAEEHFLLPGDAHII
jgi:hypothetical protein